MFRTKAYTLNRLIAEVGSLNARSVTNVAGLANGLSPRLGKKSTKFQALNTFLNGNLSVIVNSSAYGKTVKQRVIKALKARKRQGSDFTV